MCVNVCTCVSKNVIENKKLIYNQMEYDCMYVCVCVVFDKLKSLKFEFLFVLMASVFQN